MGQLKQHHQHHPRHSAMRPFPDGCPAASDCRRTLANMITVPGAAAAGTIPTPPTPQPVSSPTPRSAIDRRRDAAGGRLSGHRRGHQPQPQRARQHLDPGRSQAQQSARLAPKPAGRRRTRHHQEPRAGQLDVTQDRQSPRRQRRIRNLRRRQYQPIYGFSVYNPGTGEAYIIEVVGSDLTAARISSRTRRRTPPTIRTTSASSSSARSPATTCRSSCRRWCTISTDTWRSRKRQLTRNLLSKTNELDSATCTRSMTAPTTSKSDLRPIAASARSRSVPGRQTTSITNIPYSTPQTASFNPDQPVRQHSPHRFSPASATAAARDIAVKQRRIRARSIRRCIIYQAPPTPPAYFVCRRQNWNADCHLMQATHPTGTSIYLAFGAGDLVPFRLDTPFNVDKRLPAHMNKLTYTFADQQYDSAQNHLGRQQAVFRRRHHPGRRHAVHQLLDQRHRGHRRSPDRLEPAAAVSRRSATSSARQARH